MIYTVNSCFEKFRREVVDLEPVSPGESGLLSWRCCI